MAKYIKEILLLALIIFSNSLKAQTKSSEKVIISGVISDPSYTHPEMSFDIYSDNLYYFRGTTDAKTVSSKIIDKKFHVEFEVTKQITYLNISLFNLYGYDKRSFLFYVSPGDDIQINLLKDGLEFKGRGSDKINCLWKLNESTSSYSVLTDTSLNNKHLLAISRSEKFEEFNRILSDPNSSNKQKELAFLEKIKLSMRFLEHRHNIKLEVLKTFQNRLSPTDFDLIKVNLETERLKDVLKNYSGIASGIKINESDPALTSIQTYFKQNYFKSLKELRYNDFQIKNALLLSSNLFSIETKLMLDSKIDMDNISSLIQTFKYLEAKYSGVMFERMIVEVYSRNKRLLPIDFIESFNYILPKLKDSSVRRIIEQYKNSEVKGSPAYQFSLFNEAGQLISLRSFKGKLVIIDFWFKGCMACIELVKNMKPIYEEFKGNPKLVFLSVNIDASKQTWLEALKKGKTGFGLYSDESSLNLSTYPQGAYHPMLKYYSILGAPVVMFIDENGKIITKNPPRPNSKDNNKGLNDLRKLIESSLINIKS